MNMNSIRRAVLAAACVMLAPLTATAAGGIEQLRSFIESTQSGSASFEQKVTAKSGRKSQDASGTMAFSRPGQVPLDLRQALLPAAGR
jgi:outer membrane lipoprotein carrier protein